MDSLNLFFSIIGAALSAFVVIIVAIIGWILQRSRDDISEVKTDVKETRKKVDCLESKIVRVGTIVGICHPDMVDPLLRPHSSVKLTIDANFHKAVREYIEGEDGNDGNG